MKTLYFIGGPMGVGKTAVSRELLRLLPRCAFLDGDRCWTMHPFTVTDETKAMVTDNIAHILSSFLQCSEFVSIVFCWVLHQQQLIDGLLARLPMEGVRFVNISLVCTRDALAARIHKDIAAGLRDADCIGRALAYLPLYEPLQGMKLDTTALSPEEAAQFIIKTGDSL